MAETNLMVQNKVVAFRIFLLNRFWLDEPYKGAVEESVFAPSQIWKVIDQERKKEKIIDWSIPSKEVAHGTHAQYLELVAYMNSPHIDGFGNRLLGHSISNYATTAKACKLWEDRGRSVEVDVDKLIIIAKARCAMNVQLQIKALKERLYDENVIAANAVSKIKALEAMFIDKIKPSFDYSIAVVALLDTLPIARTRKELIATFIEMDLIMDAAKLTLLGADKNPRMASFPVPPPVQLIECLLRCIPNRNELGGIRDNLEFKKKRIERAAKILNPWGSDEWEKLKNV